MIKVEPTTIPAVKLVTPQRFGDERGFLVFNQEQF
jgi:dTDP-4-dehydrorhamnose 3,5-epimerase-like enzyme